MTNEARQIARRLNDARLESAEKQIPESEIRTMIYQRQ